MKKKLIGLMPVRNEQWILGFSARAALMWLDELVIFDHASKDKSLDLEMDLAAEHPGRVILMGTDQPTWDEMNHRQQMLAMARDRGASHIAIVDADEVPTSNFLKILRREALQLPAGAILQTPLFNLRGGAQYHANGVWGNRIASVAFANQPAARWSGDRFHSREPLEKYVSRRPFIVAEEAGIMHFWGANERRLRAKHALYKVTERLRWPDKPVPAIDAMYSQAIYPQPGQPEWTYSKIPPAWLRDYAKWIDHFFAPLLTPWQEAEVSQIVATHPAGTFDGLDLFGVA